jgi:Ser/Thr protein kinase RdoA (MazF antagonist)
VPELKALRKVGEGREAEMFEWEPGLVLRLLRDPGRQAQVQWEEAAMEAARACGVPVPACHGVVTVEGRPGLLMEAVSGPDLLTLLSQQPWRMAQVARVCGEVHARLHAVAAPRVLPPLKAILKGRIFSAAALPSSLADFALEVLERLPEGDILCHGDFHPANVLLGERGPVIIDWTNAASGDPEADVARTLLLLKFGELPPGVSWPLRLLARAARRVLATLYLRSYRRLRALDRARVDAWMVAAAAARLGEGISEEAPRLLSLLKEARRQRDGRRGPARRAG